MASLSCQNFFMLMKGSLIDPGVMAGAEAREEDLLVTLAAAEATEVARAEA